MHLHTESDEKSRWTNGRRVIHIQLSSAVEPIGHLWWWETWNEAQMRDEAGDFSAELALE